MAAKAKADAPEQAAPDAAAPEAAPEQARPVKRAGWKGGAGEYLTPFLDAQRDPANPEQVIERIYYIPARDLDDNDWRAFPPHVRRYVKAAGRLYDVAPDAPI